MKKVGFASGEVSLLRRLMRERQGTWSRADDKAAIRILNKLDKAEVPNDPGVNAPAIEDALIVYSRGKVAALALPNWQRYARQGGLAGATVADAQTIGMWMSRQDWMQFGSQTLQSVLNNWSSWLGKARAAEEGHRAPQAGINGGQLGQGSGPQRQEPPRGRPAPGFGRKITPAR